MSELQILLVSGLVGAIVFLALALPKLLEQLSHRRGERVLYRRDD